MHSTNGKQYIWLASYPKSGNTWVRIFVHAYECVLYKTQQHFNFNALEGDYLANRGMFEWLTGFDSDLFSPEDLALYRSRALASPNAVAALKGINLFKVHDRFYQLEANTWLVPQRLSRGVVYLVRNPVDIVSSWAYHRQEDVASTVVFMADEDAYISRCRHRQTFNLPQWLGSWSDHVNSWLNLTSMPLLVVRYEDLLANPKLHFMAILEFVGLPVVEDLLNEAVGMTEFSRLKAIEQKAGFRELPRRSRISTFFRQGKAGKGCEELSPELLDSVIRSHGELMKKFGYV